MPANIYTLSSAIPSHALSCSAHTSSHQFLSINAQPTKVRPKYDGSMTFWVTRNWTKERQDKRVYRACSSKLVPFYSKKEKAAIGSNENKERILHSALHWGGGSETLTPATSRTSTANSDPYLGQTRCTPRPMVCTTASKPTSLRALRSLSCRNLVASTALVLSAEPRV